MRRPVQRFDWSREQVGPAQPPLGRRRVALAIACFVAVGALLGLADFGNRGRHFDPARTLAVKEGWDLSRLRVLTRCVGYVRSNYVDPDRISASAMLVAALDQVERRVPEFVADVVRDGKGRVTQTLIRVGENERRFDLSRVNDLYALSWKLLDIFAFVGPELRSSSVDPKQVEYAAVNGMLDTLDPHSTLLTPSVYQDMKMGTTGQFGGLGIVLGTKDGRLVVESVMDGTPARRAGINSGDVIVQIEGESTVNMSLSDAVERLRGRPGTAVTLWIDRKGFAQPKKLRIVRENIQLASVTSARLEGAVGHIRVKAFQESTAEDLEAAVSRLLAEELAENGAPLRGLVLDLRDNPGGLLEQAIEVSDLFLSDGVIVTTVGSGNRVREERVATRGGTHGELPLVVLVNEGSASASEIVAGALRNQNRAVLVGQRTFGKGSVQVLYDIDDVALKLTIAQYLTPGDESIQSVGIVPHVELVPIRVSRDWVQLGESRGDGEVTLANHLENGSLVRHRDPEARVRYLSDGGGDDFELEFARRFVAETTHAEAKTALERAGGLTADTNRDQDGRVVAALGKLDVDWTPGASERLVGAPGLQVTLSGEDPGGVVAGEETRITLTVKNTGKRTWRRLYGVTHSALSAADGLELPIGLVAPGESRSWTAPVPVGVATQSQTVPVEVRLFAGDERIQEDAPPEAVGWLAVRGVPRPRFDYSLSVLDEPGEEPNRGDERNNGDGIANVGERLKLRVTVHNTGDGAARKTLVTLKNRGGEEAFITDGRAWLDGIPAGGFASATLTVEIRPGEAERLELDVQITDTVLEERLTHTLPLEYQAASSDAFVRSPARYVAPGKVPVFASAHRARVVGHLEANTVFTSPGHVGELLRVDLPDGHRGWVGERELTGAPASAVPTTTVALVDPVPIRAPRISLTQAVASETTAESVVIEGRAEFPSVDSGERPDIYVFREDDKVFFRRATEGKAEFRTVVQLEPGLNELAIYARAGRDLGARQRLFVYRKP